ncbi:MAG: fatty acid desaturase family protein [Alphaproteobacteria bacterium]
MRAHEILTDAEKARLRRRSDGIGVLYVASAWGLIFAAMWLFAIWPNPFTFLLAVMVIGGRQLGLAVLMHDAAHGILTQNRTLNNFLGRWLCAFPLGANMDAYRAYHLKHHARTQQADDPDLVLSAPFPITRASLRRKIIRDLTGQTFFKQRKAQVKAALGEKGWPLGKRLAHFRERLGATVLTNAVLFAGLALAGVWYYYFLFWLLPMATWQQMVTRIRNIAEHAVVPDNDDPFRNARTTKTGPLTALLLAPFNVNYHVEHHLFMWVPCYNLPALHRLLMRKGYGPRMELQPGYFSMLRLAASKPASA